MNLYLDNSVVNWLLRNGEDRFKQAMHSTHVPIIGEYVVLEAGATPYEARREALFSIINSLGIALRKSI